MHFFSYWWASLGYCDLDISFSWCDSRFHLRLADLIVSVSFVFSIFVFNTVLFLVQFGFFGPVSFSVHNCFRYSPILKEVFVSCKASQIFCVQPLNKARLRDVSPIIWEGIVQRYHRPGIEIPLARRLRRLPLYNVSQRYHQWIFVMMKMTRLLRMRDSQICIDTTLAQALFSHSVSCLAIWSEWLQRTSWDQLASYAGGVSQGILLLRFDPSSVWVQSSDAT